MAGSSKTITEGKLGTGLPGPIVSLMKELSCLPIFRKNNSKRYKEFSVWISKLFNGTLSGNRNENGKLVPVKFDLKTEIGVLNELSKQTMPVVLLSDLVHSLYYG